MSYRRDELLIQVAMTVAFFGCLHAGEICVSDGVTFDPTKHVTVGDLEIFPDEKMISIFLKQSKTDKFSNGVAIFTHVQVMLFVLIVLC